METPENVITCTSCTTSAPILLTVIILVCQFRIYQQCTVGVQLELVVPPSSQLRQRHNSRQNPLETNQTDDRSTENLLADVKTDTGSKNPLGHTDTGRENPLGHRDTGGKSPPLLIGHVTPV